MMPTAMKFTKIYRLSFVSIAALILAACGGGGGSGGNNTSTPVPPANTNTGSSFIYSGPAPNSVDVQRFQQAFYNNLVSDNRCGSCHTRGGNGATAFVDRTDINFAHSQALPLVNFENPAASRIVEKVYNEGSGHNCWESSPAACRVQMISYIEAWMSNGGTASTSVRLTASKDRDPNGAAGGFRNWPASAGSAGFTGSPTSDSVYDLVTRFCSNCHSEASTVKQQPYFASPDPLVAYEAIKSKIDLNDPSLFPENAFRGLKAKSRLVVRLRDEFHNCWSASCADDAKKMQDAIAALANGITPIVLDSSIYRSQAQVLNDGIVGVSGGRFELYQIALWRFLEGEGDVISDTSGVSPAISLRLQGSEADGDYQWIGGGGIQFNGGVASGTSSTSRKLYDLISTSGEYTIEAWTVPANIADEDREIISYGDGTSSNNIGGRNFLLGQTMYNYDFYNRSSATNALGMVNGDKFSSDPDREALQAALQHVVVTYDAINGRRVYVDDQLVSENYPDDKGTLGSDWERTYTVVMGNSLAGGNGPRAWKGGLRTVAIHKRALNPDNIHQNFEVKPGEKRYVMFNVSKIKQGSSNINIPASCYNAATDTSYCYVYFEVSQYDNYAYLFNKPYFISLNSDISDLHGLVIKGIHIGINGKLSSIGQGYVNVNTTINTALSYVPGDTPGSGQLLSDVGTVIPKLAGADTDLLYLEFDQIGTNTDQTAPPIVLPFDYLLNGATVIDLGWRTFDEINESFAFLTRPAIAGNPIPMSASTGVSDAQGAVTIARVFRGVRSQLPAVENFPSYLSSHQTSVTQLAVAYCSALMRDPNNYWQTFFGVAQATDLKASNWDALVDPLVDRFIINSSLYTASPTMATRMRTELHLLLTNSVGANNRNQGFCVNINNGSDICNTSNEIFNAATVTCAAALANAAMTLQ